MDLSFSLSSAILKELDFLKLSIYSIGLEMEYGAGLMNINLKDVHAVQAAGLMNVALHRSTGAQVSGLMNICGGDIYGAQISGLLNFGTRVHGSQIGVF